MATNKNRRALKRMKVKPAAIPMVLDQSDVDKHIIDTVLSTLYNNSDKDAMHLEAEIYKPHNIQMPIKEAERIWEIIKASGLITPVIGFGNSGKVELTREGYQLMAQYGSYKNYLNILHAPQQQPTFILPLSISGEETGNEAEPEVKQLPAPKKTKGKHS